MHCDHGECRASIPPLTTPSARFFSATPIVKFDTDRGGPVGVIFFYQIVFFFIGIVKGEYRYPKAKKLHHYAYFIAAHNEEAVIAAFSALSNSKTTHRNSSMSSWWPMPARTKPPVRPGEAGAIVYERNDLARKGKSGSWITGSSEFCVNTRACTRIFHL